MTWSTGRVWIGWGIALVVLILDILLKVMGQIGLVEAMVVAALCAIRL